MTSRIRIKSYKCYSDRNFNKSVRYSDDTWHSVLHGAHRSHCTLCRSICTERMSTFIQKKQNDMYSHLVFQNSPQFQSELEPSPSSTVGHQSFQIKKKGKNTLKLDHRDTQVNDLRYSPAILFTFRKYTKTFLIMMVFEMLSYVRCDYNCINLYVNNKQSTKCTVFQDIRYYEIMNAALFRTFSCVNGQRRRSFRLLPQ